MRKVIVITPFRNAAKNLDRYFSQLKNLSTLLAQSYTQLLLIALEGDSVDRTKEIIQEKSEYHQIPLTLIDVSHGQMSWKSVEDVRRLETMSVIMNRGLEEASKIANQESNDVVVWLMSDVEYNPESIISLIDRLEDSDILCPITLVSGTERFYDTWAYRDVEGNRFKQEYPYFDAFTQPFEFYEVSSAGTCLIVPAKAARDCRADKEEAVSFCRDARSKGYQVWLAKYCNVYHGDAPRPRLLLVAEILCQSGFARATHAVLPYLAEHYDIDIVGINYKGTPHNYPYCIWPAEMYGSGFAGEQTVANLIYSNNSSSNSTPYHTVIIQGDTWNAAKTMMVIESMLASYPDVKRPEKIVSWLAVDGKNQDFEGLDKFDHHIVWTEFAKEEIIQSCDDILVTREVTEMVSETKPKVSVVPLGVDTNSFYPIDRNEINRLEVFNKYSEDQITSDSSGMFVVGFVGLNQHRRRIDLIIATFAGWVHKEGIFDAYLYLKVGSNNLRSGINIRSLSRYYGIEDRVIINEYTGLSDADMRSVYNCFDLFLSCAQGGGWELPVLEAMACGVPVICAADGAVGSWTLDAALQVPCVSWLPHAPLNTQSQVLGGIIDVQAAAQAIGKLYRFENMREELKARGLELAKRLSWKNSAEKFIEAVKDNK
jgi:glycosyltransferase involved in cell wall biosynthesis/GT2 family glycosyltransferase